MKFVSALFVAATTVASVSAFITPQLPKATRSLNTPVMSIASRELEAGISSPFPDMFDPLKLSEGKSARDLKKYREAELKHGRVAMLAVVGTMVQENFHPLFGFADKEMDGAIFHFQEIENVFPSFWALVVLSIGIIEAQGIFKLWDAPGTVGEGQIAGIRDDVICGDYGFDPLGLKDDEEKFLTMRTKELNNGRLAMIAAAGITVQEKFITNGMPEFEFTRFATYLPGN
jgi:hypothetical protein